MNLFLPNEHVNSIFDITPALLQSKQKKGIIIDLDNTLVPWNVQHATKEVETWLFNMLDAEIQVTIFSNNNEERVRLFSEPLQIPFVYRAKKPLKRSFSRALEQMKLNKDDIVVIGDQLLTDILGGNLSGLYTILVVPIVQSDAKITQFNRKIESMILHYFYRKGKLSRRVADE